MEFLSKQLKFANKTIKNGAFSLSNSNKTLEKISRNYSWDGIRCTSHVLIRSLAKKTFSIKIEKANPNVYIIFGFCAKTADSSANYGYYNTQSSFTLFLANGQFWCNKSFSNYIQTDLKQAALSNQIFSAQLDVNLKTIKFYLNGKLLAPEKEIDLKSEKKEMMYPCVDVYYKGDRVSLVDQELFE